MHVVWTKQLNRMRHKWVNDEISMQYEISLENRSQESRNISFWDFIKFMAFEILIGNFFYIEYFHVY